VENNNQNAVLLMDGVKFYHPV